MATQAWITNQLCKKSRSQVTEVVGINYKGWSQGCNYECWVKSLCPSWIF